MLPRPSSLGKWEYIFFVDIEGHAEDQRVSASLRELKQVAKLFRVLGSYPRAVLAGDGEALPKRRTEN